MRKTFGMLLRDEKGITALETAIILIAFVVVASVFAFTMLSAGMFSTERSKDSIYAGLAQVRGSLELKGGIIGTATVTGTSGTIDSLTFNLSLVAGGAPIDFTEPPANTVLIEYRDATTRTTNLDWTVSWPIGDEDAMLEANEVAEVTVPLSAAGITLGPNTTFVIEVKPPSGAVVNLQRTTPPSIDEVTDLN